MSYCRKWIRCLVANIIEWSVKHADHFVYISLALNVWYAFVYFIAGNMPKFIYFGGAAVLTVGLIMMR
jgi:hypothetical protein